MPPIELAITTADKVQATSAFSEFTLNQKMLLAQIILQKLRTGQSTEESLSAVEPESELGAECETFIELHADEPADAALGVVLALLLNCE